MCYRRKDSSDISGRIYDRLVAHFGEQAVFKDVDAVPLGIDFRVYIERIIKECAVVLVIIGDRWLEASADGSRRIDNSRDHVRVEIESALKRDIPVIPLLVRDAEHPNPGSLPNSIRELAFRNGTDIRSDPHFRDDVAFVIRRLDKYIASLRGEADPPAPPPGEPSEAEPAGPTPAPPTPISMQVEETVPAIKKRPSFPTPNFSGVSALADRAISLLKRARPTLPRGPARQDVPRTLSRVAVRWSLGCGLGEMAGSALACAFGVAMLDAANFAAMRYATLAASAGCVILIAASFAFGQQIALKNLRDRGYWALMTTAGWACGYLLAAWINATLNRNSWCTNWYGAELSSSALGLPVARLAPFSSGMSGIMKPWIFQALQAAVVGGILACFQWVFLRRTASVHLGQWFARTALVWAVVTPTLNYWASLVVLNEDQSWWPLTLVGQVALGAVLGIWRGAFIGALIGLWGPPVFGSSDAPAPQPV
jgi:hypothetical protein